MAAVPSQAEVDNLKAPIPAFKDDIACYKIQLYHVAQAKNIGDIALTPSQCATLLTT